MNKVMKQFNLKHAKAEDPFGNLYLSKNLRLSLEPKSHNNILLLGYPGSGKTRYFERPNILNANASQIIFGYRYLFDELKDELAKKGKIYHFSLINDNNNVCINPLDFCINADSSINTEMVSTLSSIIVNSMNFSLDDPFWASTANLLLNTMTLYVLENKSFSKEQKNYTKVYYSIQDYKNVLSEISSWKSNKDSLTYHYYENLIIAPQKTLASVIFVIENSPFSYFANTKQDYLDLSVLENTNIDIKSFINEKSYLFIDISNFDLYGFSEMIANILLYQAYVLLHDLPSEHIYPMILYIEEAQLFAKNKDLFNKYIYDRPKYITIVNSYQAKSQIDENYMSYFYNILVCEGCLDIDSAKFVIKFFNIDKSNEKDCINGLLRMPYDECLLGEFYGNDYLMDKKIGYKK